MLWLHNLRDSSPLTETVSKVDGKYFPELFWVEIWILQWFFTKWPICCLVESQYGHRGVNGLLCSSHSMIKCPLSIERLHLITVTGYSICQSVFSLVRLSEMFCAMSRWIYFPLLLQEENVEDMLKGRKTVRNKQRFSSGGVFVRRTPDRSGFSHRPR